MNFSDEIEGIFKKIEAKAREIQENPSSYAYRKAVKPELLALLSELAHKIQSDKESVEHGNHRQYLVDIRGTINEMCKPATRYYDDYNAYIVELLTAFACLRHPTCLNIPRR